MLMATHRSPTRRIALLAVGAVIVANCGGGDNSGSSAIDPAAPAPATATATAPVAAPSTTDPPPTDRTC